MSTTTEKTAVKPVPKSTGSAPVDSHPPSTAEPTWVFLAGDGNTGKTTNSRNIAEYLNLADNAKVFLVDADEKPGFCKFAPQVHTMPIRCMDDAMHIRETAMELGAKIILVDCPGTARFAIGQAFANLRQMRKRGLQVHIVLHTGGRGSSEAAEAWMREYDYLDEIIIVLNPMRALSKQERKDHIAYLRRLPGPTNREIIELPVLEHAAARALEKWGVPVASIIDGSFDGDDINLTAPFWICAIESWWEQDVRAKKPIWDLIDRCLK